MSVPFKYLPYEIFQKPRPAPAIRVYPAAPHEFFIPKPAEKPVTPPKPVTAIRARLWSQNPHPQTQKKKKKKKETQRDPSATSNHQPPEPTDQHSAAADTIFTFNHRRWRRRPPPIPVAATPLRFQPPLPSPSSRHHSRRSQAPLSSPSRRCLHRASFQFRGCYPLIFSGFLFLY